MTVDTCTMLTVEIRFTKRRLERLYTEEKGASKYAPEVVDAFFDVVGMIRAAADERDLRATKSLHYEKLQGRKPERSLRLVGPHRLIVVPIKESPKVVMEIRAIEDYH